MTGPATVRRATAADAKLVSAALASAFSDDPVVTWLLPNGISRREARVSKLWSRTTQGYLRNDKPVYLAAEGGGAALWSPPGKYLSTPADQIRDLLPMTAVFRTALVRASHLQEQMLKAHPREPKHWYLYAIGTHMDRQGQGLGSALLREKLDEVDAAGESAYLESSNIRNVPLYERHGFKVVDELVIKGGGPSLWRMWRDPA